MRTSRPAIASAVLLTLGLTACGQQSDGAAGDGAGEIAFSVISQTDPFQVGMARAIESQAEEQGLNLVTVANANSDPAKQSQDIGTLLTRGVDGLIISAADADAIIPSIQKANQAGVPVVTVDALANGGQVAMAVSSDSKAMGAQSCEVMGDLLSGTGTVLNLQGDLTTEDGVERSDGFTGCMAEKFPAITVVSKPMQWSPEKCASVTQTVVSTSDIDGIFVASDSVCLSGVQGVLQSSGRLLPAGDPNHVAFVGIDGSPAALDAVRNGTMDAVISQPLNQYAQQAVSWLNRAIQGETFEVGPTDHDSEVLEVNGFLNDVLSAPTVTKANADDPSLWGNN